MQLLPLLLLLLPHISRFYFYSKVCETKQLRIQIYWEICIYSFYTKQGNKTPNMQG